MPKRKHFLLTALGITLLTAVILSSAALPFADAAAPAERDTNATFYNDAKFPSADPHVLYDKESGYYYAYTTDGAKSNYRFGIYRSADLATWEQLDGAIPKSDPNTWANDWFWAPECYYNENNGYYYLFYSGRMTVKGDIVAHFEHEDFQEACKTGVAVSKSPEGPFYNITDAPIDYYPYDPEYYDVNQLMDERQMLPPSEKIEGEEYSDILGVYLPFIDSNVFFDDDGQIYLYYSRNAYRNWVWDNDLGKYIEESNIYVVPLTEEWWNTTAEPVMPTIDPAEINKNKPEGDDSTMRKDGFYPAINYGSDKQSWENGHTNDYAVYDGSRKDRRWAEGSTTMKYYYTENGVKKSAYYIVYSCNNYQNELYGEGYAVSDSPLGPWKKYSGNPIVKMDDESDPPIYSTGHGSFIKSPDGSEMFHVYHGRPSTSSTRYMYTNKFVVDTENKENGLPTLKVEQVAGDQAIPSGVAPYSIAVDTEEAEDTEESDELTFNVSFDVTNNDGGSLALQNPSNRVNVNVSDDSLATYTATGAFGGVLKVAKEGTVTITYTYQRLKADGTYFNVYNIDGSNSELVQYKATYINGELQAPDESSQESSDTSIETSKPDDSSEGSSPTSTITNDKSANPKTSQAGIAIILAIAALSTGTVFAVKKSKNKLK